MKYQFIFKLFLITALLIIILSFTSCLGCLGWGTVMPDLETDNKFENDNWLVIDNMLISKSDGTVSLLKYNSMEFTFYPSYTYKVEFEDSGVKLYTFCTRTADRTKFYECVFTYNYDGQGIDYEYLSDPLTKAQVVALFETYSHQEENFTYKINILWKHQREYSSLTEQAILEHVESIYNSEEDVSAVVGSAKPINNEIWFSVVIFPNAHFNSGDPILSGVRKSEIKSYNPETEEFKTVYTHNKKDEAIIDFDENGLYTFDSDSNIKYFDTDSKESTLIYTFPYRMPDTTIAVYDFTITDNYIGASYEDGENGYCYLIYEKQNGIIANDLYSEYHNIYDDVN